MVFSNAQHVRVCRHTHSLADMAFAIVNSRKDGISTVILLNETLQSE